MAAIGANGYCRRSMRSSGHPSVCPSQTTLPLFKDISSQPQILWDDAQYHGADGYLKWPCSANCCVFMIGFLTRSEGRCYRSSSLKDFRCQPEIWWDEVTLLEAQKSHVTKQNPRDWHTLNESGILREKHHDSQCRPKPATTCRWRCHFLSDMQENGPRLTGMYTQGEDCLYFYGPCLDSFKFIVPCGMWLKSLITFYWFRSSTIFVKLLSFESTLSINKHWFRWCLGAWQAICTTNGVFFSYCVQKLSYKPILSNTRVAKKAW